MGRRFESSLYFGREIMPLIQYDLLIRDIDEQLRDKAVSVVPKWWGTLEYCELFPSMFPAERIYIEMEDGELCSCAYCYREQQWLFGKLLNVLGPLQSPLSTIYELMIYRNANVVIVNYVRDKDLVTYQPNGLYVLLPQGADLVVHLPPTFEEYLKKLGPKSRKHLLYYFRRLEREWPNVVVQTFARNTISNLKIGQIVGFNTKRLQLKGKRISRPPSLLYHATQVAQRKGLCVALMHGEELVAGTLSFLHNNDAYFIFIGHNPEYDHLNLGKLILACTIEKLINSHVDRFYLHYGHNLYKLLLGGQEEPLFQLVLFRDSNSFHLWKLTRFLQEAHLKTRKKMCDLAHYLLSRRPRNEDPEKAGS